jgi:dihydrofolate reductase
MASNELPAFNIIVAYEVNNRGIGFNGTLPWRIQEDMKYFKDVTINPKVKNVVIMGKHTWLSIPAKFRPLSDRLNIVLTSKFDDIEKHVDICVTNSLRAALQYCKANEDTLGEIFVIGGNRLYEEAMQIQQEGLLFVTEITTQEELHCNVFFPEIDEQKYKLVNFSDVKHVTAKDQPQGATFRFKKYTATK